MIKDLPGSKDVAEVTRILNEVLPDSFCPECGMAYPFHDLWRHKIIDLEVRIKKLEDKVYGQDHPS